jgi:hypothetical protein
MNAKGGIEMAKKPSNQEIYNEVVFQGAKITQGPEDTGMLEISTVNNTFGVIISYDGAELLIKELQEFIKGRAPHFARDQN